MEDVSIAPHRSLRNLTIFAVCAVTLLVFGPTLKSIFTLALHDDRYLQIALAPAACVLLLYLHRTQIFARASFSPRAGIPLIAFAILLSLLCITMPAARGPLPTVFALILVWIAAFVLCCGIPTFRASLYPLGCMFLMLPFPASWLDDIAIHLQHGSAVLSYVLIRLCMVPVLRHGTVLSMPGLDVEVAPECSGIHSSLALLMVAIVAGYLCLRSGWLRLALLLLTIPIALLKNAIRVAVTSLLGAYVDRAFIDGPFHHQYGGLIFSAVAVAIFIPVLIGLQRIEGRPRISPSPGSSQVAT